MMEKFKIKNLEIKMESFDSETGIVKGYGSIFGVKDSYDDIIMPGAFTNTLKEKDPVDIKFLFQHDQIRLLGIFTSLIQNEKGLYFEARIQKDELKDAAEAYALLKSGALNSFSIGYKVLDFFVQNEVRYITDIDLYEISLVTFPANKEATITELKSESTKTVQQPIELIKVANIESKTNEEEIKSFLKADSVPEEYKLNNNIIYTLEDNELKVCFNSIKSLSDDIVLENKEKIQLFYKAFRKEFNNYSLMSLVCKKEDIIPTWSLKEFDKYLKNPHGLKNNLTNTQLKIYNKTMAELKAQKNIAEEIENCKEKTSKEKLNLVDLIDMLV